MFLQHKNALIILQTAVGAAGSALFRIIRLFKAMNPG